LAKRVLIAEDDPLVLRHLQQTLQKAGYSVEAVGDGKVARERLHQGTFEALLTDWMMPELDGIELVRFMLTKPERAYVALITELNIPAARSHALQAGADDFFAKPIVPLQIAQSMAGWFERQARGLIKPRANGARAPTSTQVGIEHPVARTDAWKNLDSAVRQVLSDTVQIAFEAVPPPARTPDDAVRSIIPVIDTEHLMELHVLIEASRGSAAAIAQAMLGEGDPSDTQTLRDIVAELANITAGCVKTSFGKEGFPFTLGLAKKVEEFVDDYALAGAVGLRAKGIDLVARFGVRPRESVVIAASQLREGMVLAENALADAGSMLLPTGTRLTLTAAERLKNALKARSIRVCVPESAARGA
jgi:CheY-like chemotaxis protein